MTQAQRILILTGAFLIAMTMAYGVGYALFDEHQTLQGMGIQLATAFVEASKGNLDAAYQAIDNFGLISIEYRNEIHSHGHWGMLSLILIILGLVFNRLGFSEKNRLALAWLLALSAALFPLGVLFHIWSATTAIGELITLPASTGMIIGMLLAAWGLIKEPS